MKIRVLVAEDHALMSEAIIGKLKQHADIAVVATAADGPTLFSLARQHQPDIILLDLSMPAFDPLPDVKALQRECPTARCIVLTGDATPFFMHTLVEAGVWGYILKSDGISLSLAQAVRSVHAGRRYFSPEASEILLAHSGPQASLTAREVQMLNLVAQGYQNNRIAKLMALSPDRVRHVLSDAYTKLGVQESNPQINPRVAAIRKARQMGLIAAP